MKHMLRNPILPGFNPDPCICRRGDDYYIAVSTFEWMPGIPVYHSRDLVHWELLTHVITDDTKVDLKKLPSAKGIWAPCLTWCEQDGLFYVVYGVMNSMNARYFDVDNYVITAADIEGPWSEPVYLHSAGFDASLLHDDDGRKYVVSLEWETRRGYEEPGAICAVEYDPAARHIVGYPKRIWSGSTDRGCIEAPHLTKRNGFYYLMCAEGGTGYNHAVTMARAKSVFGPYEADPEGPLVTSQPVESYERADADHLKPRYYNPASYLQKSGHGSYVDLPDGETYLVHLAARPFVIRDTPEERAAMSPYAPVWPEGYMPAGILDLRCTLGRETAIEKMTWTADGWLRMADGGKLAEEYVPAPSCYEDGRDSAQGDVPAAFFGEGEEKPAERCMPAPEGVEGGTTGIQDCIAAGGNAGSSAGAETALVLPAHDDFDSGVLGNWYYAPRQMPSRFADVAARPGFARLRGEESQASLNKASFLARKLTSVHCQATTVLEYSPEVYQHDAGLMLYYDNMNNLYLRKYYSDALGSEALGIIQLENGHKSEFTGSAVPVQAGVPLWLRLVVDGRKLFFLWSYDGETWNRIGRKRRAGTLGDGNFAGPDCAGSAVPEKDMDIWKALPPVKDTDIWKALPPAKDTDIWDTSIFSDEYCKFGEFTGTMVGLFARDSLLHEKTADFDRFDLVNF